MFVFVPINKQELITPQEVIIPSMTPSTYIYSTVIPKHLPLAASNIKETSASVESTKKITSPPINKQELITPQEVLEKYQKLAKRSKITTLAVRTAKEAFFSKRTYELLYL